MKSTKVQVFWERLKNLEEKSKHSNYSKENIPIKKKWKILSICNLRNGKRRTTTRRQKQTYKTARASSRSKMLTNCWEGLIKINKKLSTCMQAQRLWSWLLKRTCSQLLGPSPGLCQNAYPIVARYWLPGYWPLKQRSIDFRVIQKIWTKFCDLQSISKGEAGCFCEYLNSNWNSQRIPLQSTPLTKFLPEQAGNTNNKKTANSTFFLLHSSASLKNFLEFRSHLVSPVGIHNFSRIVGADAFG